MADAPQPVREVRRHVHFDPPSVVPEPTMRDIMGAVLDLRSDHARRAATVEAEIACLKNRFDSQEAQQRAAERALTQLRDGADRAATWSSCELEGIKAQVLVLSAALNEVAGDWPDCDGTAAGDSDDTAQSVESQNQPAEHYNVAADDAAGESRRDAASNSDDELGAWLDDRMPVGMLGDVPRPGMDALLSMKDLGGSDPAGLENGFLNALDMGAIRGSSRRHSSRTML